MAGARTRSRSSSRATARLRRPIPPPPLRPLPPPQRLTPALRSASLASLASLAAIVSLLALASPALAADTAAPATAPSGSGATRTVEVRLALSSSAAKSLSEPRVRHLLEIELGESAILAPGSAGPLGDYVAYAWVDRPTPAQVVIEVRLGDRPVARREIAVTGLSGDAAARLVAIAASEMVRAQTQPVRTPPRRPPTPRGPTPEELEIASRSQPALVVTPAAEVAFVPSDHGVLAGPSLTAGFRYLGLSESLSARWLTGSASPGAVRWLDLGLRLEGRLWLSPSWRLALGGEAAAASVHLGDARVVEGVPGERDTWSARAGARVGVEAHLGGPAWLGLTFAPGAVLRPVRYEAEAGKGAFEGLWLGAQLGLSFEWARRPVVSVAPNGS